MIDCLIELNCLYGVVFVFVDLPILFSSIFRSLLCLWKIRESMHLSNCVCVDLDFISELKRRKG